MKKSKSPAEQITAARAVSPRKALALTAAVLAAAITATGCSGTGRTETEPESQAEITAGPAVNQPESPERPHGGQTVQGPAAYVDDFYDAVNHDTLNGWEIPAEQADMSWFRKAREDNYSKVNDLIRQASSEAGQAGQEAGSDLYNIRALNLTGLDRETRDREGYGRTAGAFLKEVDSAGSVSELLKACLQFQRDTGLFSLMGWYYEGDSGDSSVKVLYLSQPDSGLRREVWFSEDASNQKRVEEYKKYLTKLHENNGLSPEEAGVTVARVTDMMKDLASSTLKIEEVYDPEKTYNVCTAGEAANLYSSALPFRLLNSIFGIQEGEKTVVSQPDACRKLGSYLKEENLPLLKEYVKTCLYSDLSMMTDTASLDAAQEYQTAAGGIEKKKDFERTVSETVQEKLGFQCGRVFCETYFNEDAKQDVASIIRQIIDVYDNRLAHMEWMTESTRQEARKKLKAITVKVGYPYEWPQDKLNLVLKSPDQGGVYIDNIMEILKASQDYSFKTRHAPVDRNEWSMTPQTVNAYYNPGNNEIVFPAGILQAPFYDPQAEPVANLGGIGAVIGHEITHAFDTSGSQYDEKGNLRDWWTAQDKQHFRELAQKVIDYYDTMEVNGIQVNGTLSVTENIADLGGVSCITEIAKEKGYDLKELYHAYGVIWATKYRDEYLSYIMTNDTHSPGITRVNAVLSATDDFYTAFGVREGDGMYRRPEDRPHIW